MPGRRCAEKVADTHKSYVFHITTSNTAV